MPRGSHRDASHGLELPSLHRHGDGGTAGLGWHGGGAGWGLALTHGSTQAWGRVSAAAELDFTPWSSLSTHKPHPGCAGAHWVPAPATAGLNPLGLPNQGKIPPPHQEEGSGEPRAEAKTSSPPPQCCRIKFLQHFAGGRDTPARH